MPSTHAKQKTLWRAPACVAAGALCMLGFTLSPAGYVGVSDQPLAAGSPVWLLYALLLGGLFWLATGRRAARPTAGMAVMGLCFGAVNYFATTLFAYDSWAFLSGAAAWAWAAVCIFLQGAVMTAAFAVVCGWLERPNAARGWAADADGARGRAEDSGKANGSEAYEGAVDDPEMRDQAPETHDRLGHMAALHEARSGAAHLNETHGPQAGREEPDGDTSPAQARRGHIRQRAASASRALVRRFPRAAAWARRHPTAAMMLGLLMCWSPFLIAFYPGTVIWDMGEMLAQLYGLRPMSTWHPVFTTWLFGGAVGLGRLLGSDNLGALLFTLLQTAALAYALAQSVLLTRRLGLPRAWRWAMLAFFGLTPIFASFAQAIGKDTLYTAALLLYAVRAAEALRFGAPRGRRLLGLGLWALLACLLRTNGLYVVLFSSLFIWMAGTPKGRSARVGGVLAAALALAFAFNNALLPALGIADESASGFYSVLFQQSARALRDHGDTVTAQEYAAIDQVLDAEKLPELYESNISDPVKYTFRQYGQGAAAQAAALKTYRGAWLSMLKRYPLTYLEAFVAGNSGYYAFTPKIDAARTYNYQGGIRFVFETYELGADARYLHTTQIPALEKARELLAAYARGWRRVPGLELMLFCPAYTWLLAAAGFSLARRRKWRALCAFAPAVFSLGVCLLAPVNDYFRYYLPIVAMCPVLLALAKEGQGEKAA